MRVIVLVEWGKRRGHKALIEPGAQLRIGRFESADLVIPHDEIMSGLHVELRWDGSRCFGRDLGSRTGTLFNGALAPESYLENGDWLRAGDTVFSIYFEGVVPPFDPPCDSLPAPAERRASALAALRREPAPLFAVLDAARDPRIVTLLRASAAPVQSLYEGQQGEDLDDVAPYLVSLSHDAWLLERLVDEGWGSGWGIYLACRRPFVEVRRSLRRLLLVEDEETDELLYFRFYDPSSLPILLPSITPRDRQMIFGEIEAFVVEGENGEEVRLGARDRD